LSIFIVSFSSIVMSDEQTVAKRPRIPFPLMELLPELRDLVWQCLNYTDIAYVAASCKMIKAETKRYQVPRYLLPDFKVASPDNNRRGTFCDFVHLVSWADRNMCRRLIADMLMAITGLHPDVKRLQPTLKYSSSRALATSSTSSYELAVSYDLSYRWDDERHGIFIRVADGIVQATFSRVTMAGHNWRNDVDCPRDEAIQSIRRTQEEDKEKKTK
jgi:hypothetical protein